MKKSPEQRPAVPPLTRCAEMWEAREELLTSFPRACVDPSAEWQAVVGYVLVDGPFEACDSAGMVG